MSEFPFTPGLGSGNGEDPIDQGSVCVDEDGDLDVPRRDLPRTHLLILGNDHRSS